MKHKIINQHFLNHLLLLQGDTIQGTVGKNIADRKGLLKGKIYSISGFMVIPAQNSYKISPHPFRIRLLPNTMIKLLDESSFIIPFDKFNLLNFEELKSRVGMIDYLCNGPIINNN